MASAACIKTEGVPVEFKVATILLAIMALFPMPVIITRPLEFNINSTTGNLWIFKGRMQPGYIKFFSDSYLVSEGYLKASDLLEHEDTKLKLIENLKELKS